MKVDVQGAFIGMENEEEKGLEMNDEMSMMDYNVEQHSEINVSKFMSNEYSQVCNGG
jgi:hypothetical protein